MQLDGNLVAHGAGGNEDRGLAAKDLGGAGFQAIDRWIFSVHVVADFGGGHGTPHFITGQSYSIAAKVNP
jgi:hypothetical protein